MALEVDPDKVLDVIKERTDNFFDRWKKVDKFIKGLSPLYSGFKTRWSRALHVLVAIPWAIMWLLIYLLSHLVIILAFAVVVILIVCIVILMIVAIYIEEGPHSPKL